MEAKDFGDKLKKIRFEQGLTASSLAEKIGYTQPYISMLENGKKGIPKPETLKKLAKGLGVPYVDLMSEAGYINKKGAVEVDTLAEAFRMDNIPDLYDMLKGERDVYYKGTLLNDDDKRFLLDILKRSINKEGD